MKHKIKFEKNIRDGKLTILESSEVDPGVMMPLLEEEYSLEGMTRASREGFKAFRQFIRRKSFFPTTEVSMKLFEGTGAFFRGEDLVVTIEYDEAEGLPKDEKFLLEEDDVELDQLLEEDGETSEDEIKEIDDGDDDTLRYAPEDISEHEN